MKRYITKITPAFLIIAYLSIVIFTGWNVIHITNIAKSSAVHNVRTANDKFPIESFVMVTQEIKLFKIVCDDAQINCAPTQTPIKKMVATGSGVIIGKYQQTSLVLTAGHVCSTSGDTPVTEDLSIQYKMYLKSGFGREALGTILAVDSTNDLCILIADSNLGPALRISDEDPTLHEEVYTMSSPRGLAVPLAVPVFDGYFTGQVSGIYVFSIPAAPGSSGSPMMNEYGEIISVISGAAVSFDEFTIGCTTPALRNFVLAVKASL